MKYFSHDTDVRSNRKIRKVLRTHGTTGYAIWWALLEELCSADDKGFQLVANDLWLEGLAESLCISDHRTLIRVLDTFAEVKLISPQLWAEHTIYVEAIAERGDAYVKKKAKHAEAQSRYASKLKSSELLMHQQDISDYQNARSDSPYTDTDPDPDNSPDRTQKKKSADAESKFLLVSTISLPNEFASESKPSGLNALEAMQKSRNVESYSKTIEEGKPSLLEGNDSTNDSSLEVIPDPSGEKEYAAACSTVSDKSVNIWKKERPIVSQRRRSRTPFEAGLNNPERRWADLADFQKFQAYVVEDARQRIAGIKPATPGVVYDDRWIDAVVRNTANCTTDDPKILMVWTAWCSERSIPSEVESQTEPEQSIDEAERLRSLNACQDKLENYRRRQAAIRAAEQAIEDAKIAKWREMGIDV